MRGFNDEERVFESIFVIDGIIFTDTLSNTFTPLFEMEMDKAKWKREELLGDNMTDNGGWA